MNDACFCIYVDVQEDEGEFQTHKIRTARKKHVCCECREDISPGDKYEHVSGKSESRFFVYKTCLGCMRIRDDLFCEGYYYEMMWEMLIDHLREAYYDEDESEWSGMLPLNVRKRFRVGTFELKEDVE